MNYGSLPKWFREGTAEFIHGADERLLSNINNVGGGDEGVKAIIGAMDNLKGKSGSITPFEYSTSYVATRYLDNQIRASGNTDGIKVIMIYLAENDEATLDQAIGSLGLGLGFGSVEDMITTFKNNIKTFEDLEIHTGINLKTENDKGIIQIDTGSIIGSSILGPGHDKTAEDILPQDVAALDEDKPLDGFNISWAKDVIEEPIKLQIGSNEGQNIDIILSDMRAKALGIIEDGESLDVTDNEKAAEAITKFEVAIGIVSMERSKLGSYQNRLEHTIRNLDNTAENLQSAESRIADADMAIEMSIFTKLNILQQAGTSMLSQANNLPQLVLQLLK